MNHSVKKVVGLCMGILACCLTVFAQPVSFNGENLTIGQAFARIEA